MAEKKSLEERYADEVLSDNTQIENTANVKIAYSEMAAQSIQTTIRKVVAGCTLIRSSNLMK